MTFDTLPIQETANGFIPKLTVVTPSYNQARFLGATMDSVSAETGTRIDYIVMDGGSTDHSVDVIRERSAMVRHWQSKPDNGQAAAVAEGFLHADCGPADVMAYLNSDDVFCPGAIDFVLRWFALHPDVDVVYGHRIIIDESGLEVGRWILPPHDPETLSLVDFIPQETLFWRKRVYDAVGGIDPSFQFAMDWDFLLKLNKAGARFERLPWFLGCFRVHSGQKTHLQINDSGAREIALLRRREHGDTLLENSLHDVVIKANVESFWYAEQISRGVRK
ncbi:MAG: glycosyltransferase family 2 protein [Verrucomicrobiales bacterium]